MAVTRAELDVLDSCASGLSAEGGRAAAAAETLGAVELGARAAGSTHASAGLVAAGKTALRRLGDELAAGARLVTAAGLSVDRAAVAIAGADGDFAAGLGR